MPNFFERRQKAFAGFLLDERKGKKRGDTTKFTTHNPTQLHSTPLPLPLYYKPQQILQATTGNVEYT
jgi:hypothetical protein